MALIDISKAVAFDTALRHPNHFGATGDSRFAQMFIDSLQYQKNAAHFFNQANARIGQRMRMIINKAVSGQRADQYLSQANIDAIIATDVKYVLIFGIVNDGGAGFPAGDPFNNVVKPACEQFIQAGITPILFTEPGATTQAGNTVSRTGFQRYNDLLRQYAHRNYGSVFVFDLAALVLNLSTTTIAFKAGYSGDGTHYLINMAVPVGRAFASFILGIGVPPLMVPKVFGGETPALGLQIFSNPGFLTTTGGSVGAGFSAPSGVPAGVTNATCGTGITAVIDTATNADGTKDMTVAITATQAGLCQVNMDLSSVVPNAGENFELTAQCTKAVASSGSGLSSAFLFFQTSRGTVVDFSDLYSGVDATYGTDPVDIAEVLDYRVPILIPGGARNYDTIRFKHYFSAACSIQFNWRHLGMRRLQS